MSNGTFDPIASWQKMIQDWEVQMNALSGRLTESEQFSAILGQSSKMIVYAQKAMTEQAESLLQTLNLPSKSQVEALADRLDSIEDSIVQLRIALDKLAQGSDPAPATGEPRRTRMPAAKPRKD